jgi:hypothetical protein
LEIIQNGDHIEIIAVAKMIQGMLPKSLSISKIEDSTQLIINTTIPVATVDDVINITPDSTQVIDCK